MELKARKDMDPRFQWDLSAIFPDKAAWEAAYAEAEVLADKAAELKGTLGESAESLKRGLDLIAEVSEKTERVYLYAMLLKSGDNGDPEYKYHDEYVCSICRRRTVIREKYCPACGVKMDLEV